MNVMTSYFHLPISDPTWVFFMVLSIILFAPMIFTKLRIPHLIGMILAGVLIGEHGLGLLERDASFELFGKVGIYYIMFLAGLEMDMQGLKQNRTRGIIFGSLTSLIPFIFGLAAGYWLLDYSIPASILLACIFASHTLVAYPIVGRYGVNRHKSVTVSIAATMIALLFALLILAGLAGTYKGSSDLWFWIWFIGKCLVFLAGLFYIAPKIVQWFFRQYSDAVMQYSFVIGMVFLSAGSAELCGLEGILGAFLIGLVFNRFIPRTSPLMNRIEFVGNAIFIPYFLIGVGMLVNIAPLFSDFNAVIVVVVMVVAGTLSKWIAAVAARRLFRFSKPEGVMMFGLTEAHAAGALAMVMVGTKLEVEPGVPLMNNAVLDGVVMMILISCVISSIATDRAAQRLKLSQDAEGNKENTAKGDDEKIMVLLDEEDNIASLVATAVMMRNAKLNRGLIALNVVNDANMDGQVQEKSRNCLNEAVKWAAASDVGMQTQSRLAVNFVNGTVHALRENDASEIVMGLRRQRSKDDAFYGRFAQGLIAAMPRQIVLTQYALAVNTINRMVVVVPERAEYENGFYRWVERLARMAGEIGCNIDFHATERTNSLIMRYINKRSQSVSASYELIDSWDNVVKVFERVNDDQLLVVITARPDTLSFQSSFAKLPKQLLRYVSKGNVMIIYPDQSGTAEDNPTFSSPITHTTYSSGSKVTDWLSKWIGNMG